MFGFKHAIQAFGVERFKKNCNQMVMGFNYVLSHLYPQNAVISEEKSSVQEAKEKIRDAAKRASDLAMSKTIVASCKN